MLKTQNQAEELPRSSAAAMPGTSVIDDSCSGGDDCFFCTCPETD
jgi:hypothetical protein